MTAESFVNMWTEGTAGAGLEQVLEELSGPDIIATNLPQG